MEIQSIQSTNLKLDLVKPVMWCHCYYHFFIIIIIIIKKKLIIVTL